MQCGGATVLIIMNKFLIGLRNYNLRKIVVFVFVLSIVSSCLVALGAKGMLLSMVVSASLSTFLYVAFTVHAIEDNNRALTSAHFIIIAFLVLVLNSIVNLKDISDLANKELTPFVERDYIKALSPMSIVAYLLYAFAFGYGIKNIKQKFCTVWYLNLFIFIITVINMYSAVAQYSYSIEEYKLMSYAITTLTFVALILLYVSAKKEEK